MRSIKLLFRCILRITPNLKTDSCEEIIHNHCYEVIVDKSNEAHIQQRANASEWENKTNGCIKYYCDNESGGMYNNTCCSHDGINRICMNDTCVENQCYEFIVNGPDDYFIQKRTNAVEWERKTNGCLEYYCDNESGYLFNNLCDKQDGIERICMDDKCTEVKTMNDDNNDKVIIEIEMQDISVNNTNITEIQMAVVEFAQSVNIEIDPKNVGIEVNDDGQIIRIYIIVDNEDDANKLIETLDTCGNL